MRHVLDNGVCTTCPEVERRYDPGQLRDSDGKWTDGPGGAAASYTVAEFIDLYGDIYDEAQAGDLVVSVHDRGDFVLSSVDEHGRRTPIFDDLTPDKARSIADDIDWAATEGLPEDAQNEPDTRLVDWQYTEDDILVGYDHSGDVSIRFPKTDEAKPENPGDFEVIDIGAADATDLAEALRDMADRREELDDEEETPEVDAERAGGPVSGRTVEELRQILQRKYNPGQLRDPGGEGGGQWVKSPGAAAEAAGKDLLELAGRIDLDPRETLISSGRVKDDQGDLDLNFAVVHSPGGNEVRLGAIPSEDSGKWRAGDFGGTAVLDAHQLGKLRTDLTDASERAKNAAKQAEMDPDSRDPILMGHAPVAEGVIPTDWEDVTWNVYLTDSDPVSFDTVIKTGDPDQSDGVRFEPKRLSGLLKQLGAIDTDLADSETTRSQISRRYAADGGGTRTGQEAATTGPKGGQFAPGGGRVTGHGKPAPKRRPAKKAPAKPAGPLGFDGKTGAGYGIKGGDPRVRTLQSVLNRLGLTDSGGNELAVDGKFGPRTTSSVKKLQKALGLDPTGKVTEDFIKQVSSLQALPQRPKAKPKARPARKRVRRSSSMHALENGICRTCTPHHEHVLDNGICTTCPA